MLSISERKAIIGEELREQGSPQIILNGRCYDNETAHGLMLSTAGPRDLEDIEAQMSRVAECIFWQETKRREEEAEAEYRRKLESGEIEDPLAEANARFFEEAAEEARERNSPEAVQRRIAESLEKLAAQKLK